MRLPHLTTVCTFISPPGVLSQTPFGALPNKNTAPGICGSLGPTCAGWPRSLSSLASWPSLNPCHPPKANNSAMQILFRIIPPPANLTPPPGDGKMAISGKRPCRTLSWRSDEDYFLCLEGTSSDDQFLRRHSNRELSFR